MDRLAYGKGIALVSRQVGVRKEQQELTVSEGDDLAGTLGLCHSPHILYRIGFAFAGLSTEVVREVSSVSDVWAAASDPLRAETLELDPGVEEGGEDEFDKVEVALHEGEASGGEGSESHGEGSCLQSGGTLYISPGTARPASQISEYLFCIYIRALPGFTRLSRIRSFSSA